MRRVFVGVLEHSSNRTDARGKGVIRERIPSMDAAGVTSKVDHASICMLGAGLQHPGTVASSLLYLSDRVLIRGAYRKCKDMTAGDTDSWLSFIGHCPVLLIFASLYCD